MSTHNIALRRVRIEVITDDGKIYGQYGADVELSLQDDGQTLKIFVTGGETEPSMRHIEALRADMLRIIESQAR